MFITKKQWCSIEECDCGGNVFKYHDTTKNVMVAKCGIFRKIIEIDPKTKKKVWIVSKKQPCDFNYQYLGSRPEYSNTILNIKNRNIFKDEAVKFDATRIIPGPSIYGIKKKVLNYVKNDYNTIEERLKALFSFLVVSRYSSTIQQIDDIVVNNLKKEPRKTFYYPSTTPFMRVSHQESYQDYRDRIFSEKIIDRSGELVKLIPKEKPFTFFSHPLLPKIKIPNNDYVIAPTTPDLKRSHCQFIDPDPIPDTKGLLESSGNVSESDHSENSEDSGDESGESDSGESFYGSGGDDNESQSDNGGNESFYGSDGD